MARNKKKKAVSKKEAEERARKNLRRMIIVASCVVAAIILVLVIVIISDAVQSSSKKSENEASYTQTSTTSTAESSDGSNAEPTGYIPPLLDEDKVYYADIDIKDKGTITVELDQHTAPITAANFVELASKKFYDGLTFHRIMKDFMMQGGDPLGNGNGGSSNNIFGEFTNNGYENNISHKRGTLSMARGNDKNSASSQFFIVHKDYPSLDGNYAAFGHVTKGIEIVDEICEEAKPTDNNGTIPKDEQPIINSIVIRIEDKQESSENQ